MSKATRVTVTRENFFRVIIVGRKEFSTLEAAAAELNLTAGSLKQRITRERKLYPKLFEAVPAFSSTKGPHKDTPEEAAQILASLMAGDDGDDGDGDADSDAEYEDVA